MSPWTPDRFEIWRSRGGVCRGMPGSWMQHEPGTIPVGTPSTKWPPCAAVLLGKEKSRQSAAFIWSGKLSGAAAGGRQILFRREPVLHQQLAGFHHLLCELLQHGPRRVFLHGYEQPVAQTLVALL